MPTLQLHLHFTVIVFVTWSKLSDIHLCRWSYGWWQQWVKQTPPQFSLTGNRWWNMFTPSPSWCFCSLLIINAWQTTVGHVCMLPQFSLIGKTWWTMLTLTPSLEESNQQNMACDLFASIITWLMDSSGSSKHTTIFTYDKRWWNVFTLIPNLE
mgnify:CR=1 FL=1